MKLANCQIRQEPQYRRQAFEQGLCKVGYTLIDRGTPNNPDDLLVIWNRYGSFAAMADIWERKGGTVLVCENGYVGKDEEGRQYYAISATGHNGSGWWPAGSEDRFALLKLPIEEWKKDPEGYYLICGQRGIGSPQMASPPDWHKKATARLAKVGITNTRIRLHPGDKAPAPIPLNEDLKGASTCVIWSSSSGVKALLQGIPVIYDAPYWICSDAAERLRNIEKGGDQILPDTRLDAMRRMAWAQWSVKEIESGLPFDLFSSEVKRRKGLPQ